MGRDRNRELIAEYPWLDIGDKQFTLLDALPMGWSGLILDMCKEIKRELVKYNLVSKYQVIKAKKNGMSFVGMMGSMIYPLCHLQSQILCASMRRKARKCV